MPLSKGARIGIGITLGVLTLGGLSVAGYFMFRKPKDSAGKKNDGKRNADTGASASTTAETGGAGSGKTKVEEAQLATGGRGGATSFTPATVGGGRGGAQLVTSGRG